MLGRNQIELDKVFYTAVTNWSITPDNEQKLSDLLKSLHASNTINALELVSFAQQHRGVTLLLEKDWSFEAQIDHIFAEKGIDSPCNCSFILNHWASAAPLKPGAGSYHNGYDYLENHMSEMIPYYQSYNTGTPKKHRWYTNEKGPAHDMFLYSYDSGGSFNYEWSTFGINNTGNSAPSPNSAELSYNFLCESNFNELPEDCQCTKQVLIAYNYDTYYKVIADKLRLKAKAHSAVEEVAVLSTLKVGYSNPEFEVKDAGRVRVQTYCKGTFNFTWLNNLGNLIGEVFDSVSQIYGVFTDSNGNAIQELLDVLATEVPEDIEALTGLLEVSTINVEGDCTDKYGEASLLKGAFFLDFKANEPTFVTLNSYTFLGVYGTKKWNNYAITRSSFRLQGIVMPGSVEAEDFCCSDKLGNHLYGSMNGPISEVDLNDWTQGIYALFAPWDNFSTSGYKPAMPVNANRGYFVEENLERDCAPAETFGKSGLEENVYDNTAKEIEALDEDLKGIDPVMEKFSTNNVTLSLYPNPTDDLLNIKVANVNGDDDVQISMLDMSGRLVKSIYNSNRLDDNFEIKLNLYNLNLDNGSYLIFVSQNGIIKETKPFIYSK